MTANPTARDAAHDADPYGVPCPRCGAAQYVACETRWGDPHPLRIIDAALAAALPLLTPEDVPHVVAQALREAIDRVQAVYDLQCPPRSPEHYVSGAHMAHEWWNTVLGGALRDLRARADRLDPKPPVHVHEWIEHTHLADADRHLVCKSCSATRTEPREQMHVLDDDPKETTMTTCPRCDGCGQIANDDDGTPWTAWENLPPGADLAVRLGLVAPIPCPDCTKAD